MPQPIKTKLLRNYTEVLFFMLVFLIAFTNTINKGFLLHPPLQVSPETAGEMNTLLILQAPSLFISVSVQVKI